MDKEKQLLSKMNKENDSHNDYSHDDYSHDDYSHDDYSHDDYSHDDYSHIVINVKSKKCGNRIFTIKPKN